MSSLQQTVTQWPDWSRPDPASRRQARFSLFAAAVATTLLWLGLLYLLPSRFTQPLPGREPAQSEVSVRYEPVESTVQAKFVEANPNVPENAPDDTRQFSFREQQAAQEQPDPASTVEMPAVEGEIEDSQKILESTLNQEQGSLLPPGLPEASQQSSGEPAVAFSLPTPPAPDFLRDDTPPETTGTGAPTTRLEPQEGEVPSEEPAERIVPINKPGESQVEVVMEEVKIDAENVPQGVPVPQARPRLNIKAPPGPLARTQGRASRMGAVAVDAQFSEFGVYAQRMLEAISAQWNQLGRTFDYSARDIGTVVHVRFYLDREGHISNFEVVETTASRPATLLVTDAVLSRAPFGEWTQDMILSLPKKQEVTISFHYR